MDHATISGIGGLWDTMRGVMTWILLPSQQILRHDLPLWMAFQWISKFSPSMHLTNAGRWTMSTIRWIGVLQWAVRGAMTWNRGWEPLMKKVVLLMQVRYYTFLASIFYLRRQTKLKTKKCYEVRRCCLMYHFLLERYSHDKMLDV